MRTNHFALLASALLTLFAATACGGAEVREEPTPVVVQAPPPEPEPEPTDVHVEGDRITIDRMINFENNSDAILADSFELLDHIAQVLASHPDITDLQIVGHTDSVGNDQANQELSERRARSVSTSLTERGATTSFVASGMGEQEPLCEDDTDECRARNRRVEFLIVHDEPQAPDGE